HPDVRRPAFAPDPSFVSFLYPMKMSLHAPAPRFAIPILAIVFSSFLLGAAAPGADAPAPAQAPAAGRAGGGGRGGIDWNAKAAPWGPLRNANDQTKSPFKIFDNVYYVGLQTVAAYVITTSDGLVLLDAAYSYTTDQLLEN